MYNDEKDARDLLRSLICDGSLGVKMSQKLALALRRLVVSWLLEAKPRLIQSATEHGIKCYGGYELAKRGHEVTIRDAEGPVQQDPLILTNCGVELINLATSAITLEYRKRLSAWVRQELAAFPVSEELEAQLTKDYPDWVIDGMKPRWWSRKVDELTLTKLILKHAWDKGIFDREIWGMTIKICGMTPHLHNYNEVARQLEDVRARLKEAPNLAPLLYPAVGPYHKALSFRADVSAISRAREALMAAGCTPAGWRWLTKQVRQWVMHLHRNLNIQETALFVSLMAANEVGRLPTRFIRPSAIHSWMTGRPLTRRECVMSVETMQKQLGVLMRLSVQSIRARKTTATQAAADLMDIYDYVAAGNTIPKGATWKSVLRRQEEWHRAIHRQRIETLKAERHLLPVYAWPPLVSETSHKEFRAVGLGTSEELWEEGERLVHCVGGYADECLSNRSRIFSIRTTEGESLATLELRRYRNRWEIAQLRARRNRPVKDEVIKELSKKVLAEVSRVKIPDLSENKLIRDDQRPRIPLAEFDNPAFDTPF